MVISHRAKQKTIGAIKNPSSNAPVGKINNSTRRSVVLSGCVRGLLYCSVEDFDKNIFPLFMKKTYYLKDVNNIFCFKVISKPDILSINQGKYTRKM